MSETKGQLLVAIAILFVFGVSLLCIDIISCTRWEYEAYAWHKKLCSSCYSKTSFKERAPYRTNIFGKPKHSWLKPDSVDIEHVDRRPSASWSPSCSYWLSLKEQYKQDFESRWWYSLYKQI